MRSSYLLGTSGFIYVIDPTREQTFERFNDEILFISTNYPQAKITSVANKCDLVALDDFKELLLQKNIIIDYFTSAKTGNEVENVFLNIAKKLL